MFYSKAKYGTPPLFWTRTILDVRSLAGRQNDIDRTRVPRPRPVQPDGAVWLCGSVWPCSIWGSRSQCKILHGVVPDEL